MPLLKTTTNVSVLYMLHNGAWWSQWHSYLMWRPEQDVKVAPTECVARAITCGVHGLVIGPLVGFRGAEGWVPFDSSSLSHYLEADELFLNRNIALVWPKRSLLGWIYIWWALRYVISFLFSKKCLKLTPDY